MAHSLSLSYDAGSYSVPSITTIPLNGLYTPPVSNQVKMNLQKYVPARSEAETVTETAEVLIENLAGTIADIRSAIYNINRAFLQAEKRLESKKASPVYLQIQPNGASDIYRSEVRKGTIDWNENSLLTDWGSGHIKVSISWERVNYWEDTVETAATISNANGSGTSGINVYPVGDLTGSSPNKRDNSVLTSSTIPGDLPAYCRLEMTCKNVGAATKKIVIDSIRVFNNVYSDPINLTPDISSESGTGGTQKPASPDANKYSDSYYRELSFSTTEVTLITFDIPDANTERFRSNYFALLGLFSGGMADCKLRILVYQYGTLIYDGPFSTFKSADGIVHLLDVIRLPPGLPDLGYQIALRIDLKGKSLSGSILLGLDVLFLMPLDYWIKVAPVDITTVALLANDSMEHDSRIDAVYYNVTAAGTNKRLAMAHTGKLMLIPGKVNRLIFNFISDASDATYGYLANYMTVKLWYRARRRAL